MKAFILLLFVFGSGAMAVDQRKFRTCEQTSFCRRHREQHSSRLYDYKIDVSSVKFHIPQKEQEQEEHAAAAPNKEGTSLWNSLQQRWLGSSTDHHKDLIDPHVRGPPPTLTGRLRNRAPETSTHTTEVLEFSIHALSDGLVRLRIHEVYEHGKAARVTYDDLVLSVDTLVPATQAHYLSPEAPEWTTSFRQVAQQHDGDAPIMGLQYGNDDDDNDNDNNNMLLVLQVEPFAAYLYRQDDLSAGPIVQLGHYQELHFEIRRPKDDDAAGAAGQPPLNQEETLDAEAAQQDEPETPEKEIVGYWEDGLAIYADGTREERKEDTGPKRQLTEVELDREGLWEESFGDHKDSKPHGPMSVGADITFPTSKHVYGLPEHASSMALKNTIGEGAEYSDPYRLYNLDVFEYDLDVPMALYGAVPLLVSQSMQTGTAGAFWFNPTETFVDIQDRNGGKSSHWMSESGIIDLFLIPGPTPEDLYRQYSKLTGLLSLPPMFSLGYHQCRWNYKDEQDVYQVHGKFEELDHPYDVLWLDIEHTDGKRYFTWDKQLFPNPKKMQETLWSQGRRMVTIIDPHVKRDDKYHIHKDATANGLYIKDKEGKKDYDGWCWPGSSSYLDFTNERARDWWAEQFSYSRYQGSTPSLFTWNDMNEPSVFNGPEVSMQKDLLNLNGEEHREWHNLYGMLFQRATAEGLTKRNKGENIRPFVLSRAFFAGSQKYGAIWTGDNAAEWSHLEIASPMLLSLNVGALSFVGADVGGFFGNTDEELMTRWVQAGAYTPFFRGHAHHDAKRREPWMFGEETMVRLRKAAMARYALLPFWYTIFAEAGRTGMPVMRAMWMQYPKTESLFAVDDQYLIGSDLLVHPVPAPGATECVVQFPQDHAWYDAESLVQVAAYGSTGSVSQVNVPCDIDTIPVFQRGGSIIPRKLRLRRSSHMMQSDPYTLFIALDQNKKAMGQLYMDDEVTFDYARDAAYALADISAEFSTGGGILENDVLVGSGWESKIESMAPDRRVERIVIMGLDQAPSSVDVHGGLTLGFTFDSNTKVLVVRKPDVSQMKNWKIHVVF